MAWTITDSESLAYSKIELVRLIGGKAMNLSGLLKLQVEVPPWFSVTVNSFNYFIRHNKFESELTIKGTVEESGERIKKLFMELPFPADLEAHIREKVKIHGDHFCAVRSSGTEEDSSSHSFAGQYESYLFQKGGDMVIHSLRECWASCFADRVLKNRTDWGLDPAGSKMGVLVQRMVNSDTAGVCFSRHPLRPMSFQGALVEAVIGLGEGLVSGLFEADRFEVLREQPPPAPAGTKDKTAGKRVIVAVSEKPRALVRAAAGGLVEVDVAPERVKAPCLTEEQAVQVAARAWSVEKLLGHPQDMEWAFEDGKLYFLQTRPIVVLPPSIFFGDAAVGSPALGTEPILWDNSNIVESYSGVTTPLTFSFAEHAYHTAYLTTLITSGVPKDIIDRHDPFLRNMLGLVRGNIYYNLFNWYRALACLPIAEKDRNKMMDTMMGVKQGLDPALDKKLGSLRASAPSYGFCARFRLVRKIIGVRSAATA